MPGKGAASTRRRLLTGAASVAAHLGLLAAVLLAHGSAPEPPDPAPMAVELVTLPPPPPPLPPAPPAPEPPAAPTAAPPKPSPPRLHARTPKTPPAQVETVARGDGAAELSDAQVAGAATAGSGVPGRPCDMTQRLQAALRRDVRVQAAVADARAAGASSRAMLVWNGEWVRSNGQDGAGLAALREAISWEVGFAPEACRAEAVRGLVLISLNDGPGAARLVLGSGQWRWSDLLHRR